MELHFPPHKTKIVATIGPGSRSEETLKRMLANGLNVARLNFSHGDPAQHARDIQMIRAVAASIGRVVAILADLPGPKIRIGQLAGGAVELARDARVVLTTKALVGDQQRIPVGFDDLPASVKTGQTIYLNDGFIQLAVVAVAGDEVDCRVVVGGRLLSHKGINLPDARLEIEAVTAEDRRLIDLALQAGVDALGVSFVQAAADIHKVREIAAGRPVQVVAKIERREALEHIDDLIDAADGVMVARGDLGVEIPIERVPLVQKTIIRKANLAAKPVITATQMLESMTDNIRPTRAEVTDVANAILDGTDAVMLSEETAIGAYPAEAVAMLARVARETERQREALPGAAAVLEHIRKARNLSTEDVLSLDVIEAVHTLGIETVATPTVSGGTPRRIARYHGPAWIVAFCPDERVHHGLALSYGVLPVLANPGNEDADLVEFLKDCGRVRPGDKVIIARRRPTGPLGKINSLEIISLKY